MVLTICVWTCFEIGTIALGESQAFVANIFSFYNLCHTLRSRISRGDRNKQGAGKFIKMK